MATGQCKGILTSVPQLGTCNELACDLRVGFASQQYASKKEMYAGSGSMRFLQVLPCRFILSCESFIFSTHDAAASHVIPAQDTNGSACSACDAGALAHASASASSHAAGTSPLEQQVYSGTMTICDNHTVVILPNAR